MNERIVDGQIERQQAIAELRAALDAGVDSAQLRSRPDASGASKPINGS